MKKEMIDTLNELSKKPITDLAMSYMEVVGDNMIKDKEIARLNKIIEELEKWLKERLEKLDLIGDDEIYSGIEYTLNKLKELKEEGKE